MPPPQRRARVVLVAPWLAVVGPQGSGAAWVQGSNEALERRASIDAAAARTFASCWTKDFTYERCCLNGDKDCFLSAQSAAACCSGWPAASQVLESSVKVFSGRWTAASPSAPPHLVRCLRAGDVAGGAGGGGAAAVAEAGATDHLGTGWQAWTSTRESELCDSGLTQVAACIASLPDVSVVLDLFLGGGCTAKSIAESLNRRLAARTNGSASGAAAAAAAAAAPGERAPEIFSFEHYSQRIYEASIVGFPHWHATRLRAASHAQLAMLQRRLLVPPPPRRAGRAPRMWMLQGSPYPNAALMPYKLNGLDSVCLHRQPIDMVLIDSGVNVQLVAEWPIIEAVCRPRWVVLHDINLPNHAPGWIYQYLQDRPSEWRMEVQGRYALYHERWVPPTAELKRVRSWAVFFSA